MKKVIIVGNGFDLANGIKSSYQDFLIYIIKKEILETNRNPFISTKGKNGQYKLKDNELFKITIEMSSNYDKLIRDIMRIDSLDELIKATKDGFINVFIKSEIIKNYFVNWSDFEKSYFQCLKNIHEGNEINPSKELRRLNDEFRALRKLLIEYLKEIQLGSNIDYYSKKGFQELLNILHPNHNYKVLVVCFNYTNTLTHYTSRISQNHLISILHIHGNINDYEVEDEVIFGYDDNQNETYISILTKENQEFLEFFKNSLYNTADNYSQLRSSLNAEIFEVHILGHSLESSDASVLREILNHQNCTKIKIYYNPKIGLED